MPTDGRRLRRAMTWQRAVSWIAATIIAISAAHAIDAASPLSPRSGPAPAPGGAPAAAMMRLVSQASSRRQAGAPAPAQGPGECVGRPAGLVPDPADCACFYACSGFGTGVKACCTATIFWRCFNPEINWCDLCSNVDTCVDGGAPPPVGAPPPKVGPPPSPVPQPSPTPAPVPSPQGAPPPKPTPMPVPSPQAASPPTPMPTPGPQAAPPPKPTPTPSPGPSSAPPGPIPLGNHLLTATYWGQGQGMPVNGSKGEPALSAVCEHYNVVTLQYLPLKLDAPGALTNLAVTPKCAASGSPSAAARCASVDLSLDLRRCQELGKLVLLGLSQGNTTLFNSDKEAADLADGIWNLYLAGTASNRPFGQLVLDGVDIQSQGSGAYYPAFVRRMWGHMDKAPKKYYLTASVGCRYPDPSLGALFGQDGNLFDFISVRFFNDRDCSGSTEVVDYSYSKHWAPLANSFPLKPPRLFITLPAIPDVAVAGYLNASEAAHVLISARSTGTLAGLSVWTAAGDLQSVASSKDNKTWSQQVLNLVPGASKADCT